MLTTMSISVAPALTDSRASCILIVVVLFPAGNAITEQIATLLPSRILLAAGIEYGFMHTAATSYSFARRQPEQISLSVIVGCRREWSIILASCLNVTVIVDILDSFKLGSVCRLCLIVGGF